MLLRVSFLFVLYLGSLNTAAPQSAPGVAESSKREPAPTGPRISFNYIHVDGPFIAMTFDDGPSQKLTPRLLSILADHHIKATFFVLGENVHEYPEIVARAAQEGHEIGSHSWSHPNLARMSDENVRSQLRRTDEAIKAAVGKSPTLFRPPYGALTTRQKRWIHDEFGYDIIMWDVDPFDWKRPGPTVVTSRIVKETRAGSIILSHDIHPPTIEAMPATFDQLQANGFRFVTVSELISRATPQPSKTTAEPASTMISPAEPTRADAVSTASPHD
jgi:peptidoglycan/xylan/chitin deacetylase (PgdA/CDA1 family)